MKFIKSKLSDFYTLHKGGGEAEKPFRAVTFDKLNQPRGWFNHHLLGERSRIVAQTFNVSYRILRGFAA